MTGKLALITGASAGLGLEYARLAARDGHDLWLVARREPLLQKLAAELEKAHGVSVSCLAADLQDASAPQRIFDAVAQVGRPLDLLVNNAGFGSSGPFLDQRLEREAGMVEVNVQALLQLSWLFGRQMRERGAGRILNVASTAGFQPGPFMATYYATKAFVLSFSEALAHELRGSGVTVTAHCPGATQTEFGDVSGNVRSRLFQDRRPASAVEVARHGWRALHAGEVVAIHGGINKLVAFSVRLGPRSLVRRIAASLNRT
jgi:short-subunit dehydrogenase